MLLPRLISKEHCWYVTDLDISQIQYDLVQNIMILSKSFFLLMNQVVLHLGSTEPAGLTSLIWHFRSESFNNFAEFCFFTTVYDHDIKHTSYV